MMHTTLRPYQRKPAEFLLQRGVHGLGALYPTGSGKTLTSIHVAATLYRAGLIQEVVVLTKKSILTQFARQIPLYDATLNPHIFHVNTATTFLFRTPTKPNPAHTLLIVDEVHEFINPDTKQFQALYAYANQCARVFAMTATLFVNSFYDVCPIVALLRAEPVLSRSTFERTLLGANGMPNARFRQFVQRTFSVLVLDKNKDPRYPTVIYHEVSIPMKPKTVAFFDALAARDKKKPFFADERQHSLGLASTVTEAEARALSLRQEKALMKSSCEKCAWLLRAVPKWIAKGQGRILLYTAFINKGTDILRRMFINAAINAVIIDGTTSALHRRKVVDVFNRPPPPPPPQLATAAAPASTATAITHHNAGGDPCGFNNTWFERRTVDKEKRLFAYYDRSGNPIPVSNLSAEQLRRTQRPPIPPGWTPARVCQDNTKTAWAAMDKTGKWQRMYSADWETVREKSKMDRLLYMDAKYWRRFHHTVDKHVRESSWTKNKLHAVAVKVFVRCFFRIGTKVDENDEKESRYGVSTMLKRHAVYDAATHTIRFEFLGKSSKVNRCQLDTATNDRDPAFYKAVLALVTRPGSSPNDPLFTSAVTALSLRAYLKKNGLRIRPKDFRTHRANYRVLDDLCAKPTLPVHTTNSQRKRWVHEAIALAARDLNNTPAVCKKSYVFSPIWMLYLTHPAEFQRISHDRGLKSTNDKLVKFLDLFQTKQFDWKLVMQQYRETFGLATFSNQDVPVMIISDAGAESLDLKRTRHVVLIDSIWTPAHQDQTIGRAQRFDSHATLPPEERTVHVWKLILDYPKSLKRHSPERKIAILLARKAAEEKVFNEILASASI